MAEFSVVGKREPMLDGPAKACGRATYVDDMTLPGMLYGKILRSPHPHARILSANTSKAKNLPGVKAVITGADIPPVKYGIVPKAKDEYALAIGKVRYIGDDVAAVAAVDLDTAQEALDLIEVEYEPLPPVFDPIEAMKEGAPLIHEELSTNISAGIRKEFGDIEAGFGGSDLVLQETFRTQAINHCPMEPQAALALFDHQGKLTIWASKQIPFFLRRNLATTLGIPESKIRVIKPTVGGGFGQKIDMFASDWCAAFLSMKTGRPVKIVYEREEVFTATRQRHPMIITLKTGARRDGTIMAQQCKLLADGGAYNSTAPLLVTLSCYFMMIPYRLPALLYEGHHVYTNKPVGGAMRGHGIPQIRFAVETQLDMIAEELGLDKVQIRLKNAIEAGEEHAAKFVIRSCGFKESIIKAAQAIGWKEKKGNLPPGRGIGIACSSFPSGVSNMSHIYSGAIVKIGRDAAITLLTGAADIGQGAETVLAQIAAEELGVPLEDIRVTAADTELTPLDPGTFGSGVTLRAGNAAKMAAADAKRQLFEVVAEKLECSIDDLQMRDRTIYVKGSPEKSLRIEEGIKAYQYREKPMPIVGRGSYYPPAKEPTTLLKEDGNFSPAYSFMTQAAEVEVNRETGEVKVLKMVTAHDCGRAINPMLVEGQLDGSVCGGMGQALYEDLVTEEGHVLNPSFLGYAMPTSMEMPRVESYEIETDEPEGPFGAKEAGEGTQVATAPAITNAIHDATGVWIRSLPWSPEKILKASQSFRK